MSRVNQNQSSKQAGALKVTDNDLPSILLHLLDNNDKLVVLASAHTTHSLPLPHNYLAQLVKTVATHHPARFYGLDDLLDELVPTVNRLAAEGLTPLVLLSSADLTLSYARLAALCLQRLPVLLLLDGERASGQTLIPAETNDISVLLTLPPLLVGIPAGPRELKDSLQAALAYETSSIALVYRHHYQPTKTPVRFGGRWDVGKAYMLREGKDLAILAVGAGVAVAMETAERLAQVGLEATVVDAVWVRPLDAPLITAIAAHLPRLVTMEDGRLNGGFGTAVLELLEQTNLFNVKVKRLSIEQSVSPAPEIVAFLKRIRELDGFSYHLPAIGKQLNTEKL